VRNRGREHNAHPCQNHALRGLLRAFLAVSKPSVAPLHQASRRRVFPHLAPAVMTDRVAESQHRVDMRRSPMHPRPCEPGLHDHRVGAFPHPRTTRPPGVSGTGIWPLRFSCVPRRPIDTDRAHIQP
jgi:hypothetical protein